MIGAFAAQVAAGATWSLLLTGTLLTGNFSVALLSIRFGYGHFKMVDLVSLVIAVAGIGLWKLTHDPLAALIVIICVDFLGNWLTIAKVWRAPYSETLSTWVLMGLASMAGALAVGSWHLATLILPLYLIVMNGLTALEIIDRRTWRKQRMLVGRRAAQGRLV